MMYKLINSSKMNFIPEKYRTAIFGLILCIPVFFIYFYALNSIQNKITFILTNTLTTALMYFIAALSLDLEVGSLGLPNFGKVAFIAIGAYITTIIMNIGFYNNFFIDFLFGLLISIVISAFFGWLIAIPSVKLRADYFAIMTIAAGEVVREILQNEKRYFWRLTDPSLNIKEPLMLNSFRQELSTNNLNFGVFNFNLGNNTLFSLDFNFNIPLSNSFFLNLGSYNIGFQNYIFYTLNLNFGSIYYWQLFIFLFFLFISLLCYILVEIIRRSPYGRTLRAIREDDITVTSVGKDVYAYRWQVTVVAAIICSISGSLYCIVNSSFEPIDFLPAITFLLFVYIIIGGVGNSKGVAFGTILIQMFSVGVSADAVKSQLNVNLVSLIPNSLFNNDLGIHQLFSDLQLNFFVTSDNMRFIILGLILLVFLLYKPDGIIPESKSNNESYLSLLTSEERSQSDSAVRMMQSVSEKERLESDELDTEGGNN